MDGDVRPTGANGPSGRAKFPLPATESACYLLGMRISLRSALVGLAVVATSLFALSGVAGAQQGDNTSGAYVGAETVSRTPELAPQAAGASTSAAASPVVKANALAFTGSDVAVLALMGGVALLAGVAFLAARRKTVNLA